MAQTRILKGVEYQWPPAEDKRWHIHSIIDRHGLPVTHKTTRQGRPYTLVLRKQPVLFKLDAARREKQTELSRWLKQEHRALAGGVERPAVAKKGNASGVERPPAAKKGNASGVERPPAAKKSSAKRSATTAKKSTAKRSAKTR